jgi:hypothetical protein
MNDPSRTTLTGQQATQPQPVEQALPRPPLHQGWGTGVAISILVLGLAPPYLSALAQSKTDLSHLPVRLRGLYELGLVVKVVDLIVAVRALGFWPLVSHWSIFQSRFLFFFSSLVLRWRRDEGWAREGLLLALRVGLRLAFVADTPVPFKLRSALPLRTTNSTRRKNEEEEQQQQFGLRGFPVLAGEVVAVRGGDPRTSKEDSWWLAELLQPLALGTTHVRVRWLERDLVRQKQLHDTSRVYRRIRHSQTIHTTTIFALEVGYERIGETLVQVDLLVANELDRDWYDFDCQVEHSVDTATPAGSRTKRRRSE